MWFEQLETRAMLTSLSGDFNGDGFDDLVIGAASETAGTVLDAGVVHILYGSSAGPTAEGNQIFSMETPGINGVATTGDQFGNALAVGDFNGDGFDDLAIGTQFDSFGGLEKAGSVNIIYGSAAGLTATNDQQLTQDSSGINSVPFANELFGAELAAGDFNNDGFDDLAIGAKGERLNNLSIGGVHILFGAATGLSNVNDQLFTQETPGIDGVAAFNETFGGALFAADFNGDDFTDLAIGVPQAEVNSVELAGEINVLYGGTKGLLPVGDQLFRPGIGGILGHGGDGGRWGSQLTAGDFNNDGFADLAASAPFATVNMEEDSGLVAIIYGSANKLTATGDQLFSLQQLNASLEGDRFGNAIIAADFDGDGDDDLAIGAPFSAIQSTINAGTVSILFGGANGLTTTGFRIYHQNTNSIQDAVEPGDFFGFAVTAGDFNGDGRFDLAIGVFAEDLDVDEDCGAVHVLFGSSVGPTIQGNLFFAAGTNGLLGENDDQIEFGGVLA